MINLCDRSAWRIKIKIRLTYRDDRNVRFLFAPSALVSSVPIFAEENKKVKRMKNKE